MPFQYTRFLVVSIFYLIIETCIRSPGTGLRVGQEEVGMVRGTLLFKDLGSPTQMVLEHGVKHPVQNSMVLGP